MNFCLKFGLEVSFRKRSAKKADYKKFYLISYS